MTTTTRKETTMTTRTALPASAFGPNAAKVAAREAEAAVFTLPPVDARTEAVAFNRKPSSDWRG